MPVMKIYILILNNQDEPYFRSAEEIPTDEVWNSANQRLVQIKGLGLGKAQEVTPAFASELVKAVNEGEHLDVSKAVFKLTVWIEACRIFSEGRSIDLSKCNPSESDIHLVISSDGGVILSRAQS